MAFPVVTYLHFRLDADKTVLADGSNVTSVVDDGMGITLSAISGNPANQVTYSANGFGAGVPGYAFNGTGGLTSSNVSALTTLVNGIDKNFSIVMRIKASSVGATQYVCGFSSTVGGATADNPFLVAGLSNTSAWQLRKRDINTNSGGGVGTPQGTANTSDVVLSFICAGSTASIFVNGTLVGSSFSFTASTFTADRFTIGGLLRSTFGSGFNGLLRRIVIAGVNFNSTERAAMESWVGAPPDTSYDAGLGSVEITGGGTSQFRGFGTPSPTTDQAFYKVGVTLGYVTTNYAQNGTGSWDMQPTGYSPPSFAAVWPPDPTRNITLLVNSHPDAIVIASGPEVDDYDLAVAAGYTGTWDEYLEFYIKPNWLRMIGAATAANIPVLISAGSVASDDDTTPNRVFVNRRVALREKARKVLAGFWWNQWSVFADYPDNTAINSAVQADGRHPTAATHTQLATSLEQYMVTLPTAMGEVYEPDSTEVATGSWSQNSSTLIKSALDYIISDSDTLFDAVATGLDLGRSVSDSVSVSDQTTNSLVYNRTVSTDSVATSDQSSIALVYDILLGDSLSLADTSSTSLSYAKSLQDSVSLTDQASGAREVGASLSDAITIFDDTVVTNFMLEASLQDSLDLEDQTSFEGTFNRTTSDAVALQDLIVVNPTLDRDSEDVIGLSDQLLRTTLYSRDVSDLAVVLDTPHTWKLPADAVAQVAFEGGSDMTAVVVAKDMSPPVQVTAPKKPTLPKSPPVFLEHPVVDPNPPKRRQR